MSEASQPETSLPVGGHRLLRFSAGIGPRRGSRSFPIGRVPQPIRKGRLAAQWARFPRCEGWGSRERCLVAKLLACVRPHVTDVTFM